MSPPLGWKEFVVVMMPYLIALGSLVVSAIIAWFGYRAGKTSLYREKLYSKQIEAYEILFAAIVALNMRMAEALTSIGFHLDKTAYSSVVTMTEAELDRVLDCLAKYQLFVSRGFGAKVAEYLQLVTSDIYHPDAAETFLQDAKLKLNSIFIEIARLAQKELRIEPLTKETQEIIGTVREDIARKNPSSE